MRFFLFLLIIVWNIGSLFAQSQPNNGAKESQPSYYALKNATIYISPEEIVSNATLIIKNDKVVEVGKNIHIPKGAVIIDCKGKTILPAFIELNSSIGLPKLGKKTYSNRPQYERSKAGAYYWNEAIHPEINAQSIYKNNVEENKKLRQMGFGFALTHQNDGIMQGEATFIAINDEKSIILPSSTNSFYSFRKGHSQQAYPSSQMGAIALIRQTYYDLDWYKNHLDETNISLDHLMKQTNGNLFLNPTINWRLCVLIKLHKNLIFTIITSALEMNTVF